MSTDYSVNLWKKNDIESSFQDSFKASLKFDSETSGEVRSTITKWVEGKTKEELETFISSFTQGNFFGVWKENLSHNKGIPYPLSSGRDR